VACPKALSLGQSVVLDNTFLTVESRAPFIAAARAMGVPIECHWMQTSFEDCQVNALNRMWDRYEQVFQTAADIKAHPEAKKDPNMFPIAAMFFAKKRLVGDKKKDIPSGKPAKAEGFSKIVKVPFKRDSYHPWRADEDYNPGKAAIILDYDGTLRRDVKELGGDTHYPTDPSQVEVLPNRTRILRRYVERGYLLLGVTTQSGIGKGLVSEEMAVKCLERTNELLRLDIQYEYCPHYNFPVSCFCRKPQPGLGVHLIRKYDLEPSSCVFVGDLKTDKTFAERCGFKFEWAEDFFGISEDWARMHRICDDRGINLSYPPHPSPDQSFSIHGGKPEIFLGQYEDQELRLISFFHELGHIVSTDEGKVPKYEDLPYYHYAEAVAWKRGLELAVDEGVAFSGKALEWAKEQLATYFLDDHPEKTPAKHLAQALQDAGLA